MAGTIRKRTWVTRKGEAKTAWLADYFDQYRHRHTKQFATKKAADAWLLQTRGEVRDGTHTPDAASITVTEAGELWLERGEREGLERGTMENYRRVLRLHIKPHLGRVRLAQLTAPMIETYRDEIMKTLSRRRVQQALSGLKGILANARRRGLVVHNAADATHVDLRKRERELLAIGRDIPSRSEVQAILDAAPERWRPVLVTAAFTGMRASELRGLTWDAVDLAGKVIHVRQRADFWKTMGAPKSAAGRREIPLMPIVVNVLREWRIAYPYGSEGFVFCVRQGSTKGGAIRHADLWAAFRRVQQRGAVVDGKGEAKYHFHALRHFFASAGIEAGFAPKRLQVMLGHTSITMTYDVYGHLFPNPDDDYARLVAMERAVLGK